MRGELKLGACLVCGGLLQSWHRSHGQWRLGCGNRGIARTEQGRLSEALSDLNKAIGIDSGYALAYLNRGIVLWLQGKMAEADKDFHRCLELNPNLKQILEERRKEVAQKHTAQQYRE